MTQWELQDRWGAWFLSLRFGAALVLGGAALAWGERHLPQAHSLWEQLQGVLVTLILAALALGTAAGRRWAVIGDEILFVVLIAFAALASAPAVHLASLWDAGFFAAAVVGLLLLAGGRSRVHRLHHRSAPRAQIQVPGGHHPDYHS